MFIYIDKSSLMVQTFLSHEQLQKQFSDKLPVEAYKHYFKNVSIENVIRDLDVPQGCDADAPEYVVLCSSDFNLQEYSLVAVFQ
jgi:hypothetical protein